MPGDFISMEASMDPDIERSRYSKDKLKITFEVEDVIKIEDVMRLLDCKEVVAYYDADNLMDEMDEQTIREYCVKRFGR
jgi:hypothetical protein